MQLTNLFIFLWHFTLNGCMTREQEYFCFISLQTFGRFRKRNSVVGSLSSLISKQSNLQEGRWTHVPPTPFDWQLRIGEKTKGNEKQQEVTVLCVFAEEMHAEICYAECLLQKATLTFVQVRSAVCRLSAPLTVYLIIIIIIIISFNKNIRLKKATL